MQFEQIEVFTHSGFKADERPLSFIWRGQEHRVREITDRWYDGGLKPGAQELSYFRVQCDDGRDYLLRYNRLFDGWAIVVPPQPAA